MYIEMFSAAVLLSVLIGITFLGALVGVLLVKAYRKIF